MTTWATLGEKRAELIARLGFAATGAAAGVMKTNIDSILRTAQATLYEAADWVKLRKYEVMSLGVNQYLIDYPTNANPERVKAISVDMTGSNDWSPPIAKGIAAAMYSTQDNVGWPQRWEASEQIELWPKNDTIRNIRVFYIQKLARLTDDNDRFTIDDTLVFLVALGDAKAHYRQPDAQLYLQRAESLLTRLRGQARKKAVFSPYDYQEENALSKPQVI